MEVNNLASCWLAAGLSVGEEEEGKTALQIDTMACAPTGEEGIEEGREAKKEESEHNKQRRDSLNIRTQMGWGR